VLEKLKDKTCLVTGASGFVGTYLCKELIKEGAEVKGMFRDECSGAWDSHVLCKLGEQSIPGQLLKDVDIIFHLAGHAHSISEDPAKEDVYFKTNVNGTRDLLQAAEKAGVERIIYYSSVKSMGEETVERLDEAFSPNPTSLYGKSKLEAEKLVLYGDYVTSPTVLRLPLVYGPSVKGNFPRMVRAISKNRFPPFPKIENKRSMIHVNDVVHGTILAASNPNSAGKIYILTDGVDYSTRQLYELICESIGKKIPLWTTPVLIYYLLARAGDWLNHIKGDRKYFDTSNYQKLFGNAYYSYERARAELEFQSRHTLADSLPSICSQADKK